MSGLRSAARTALPLAVAVLTLGALLAGCGGSDEEPVEIGKVARATVSEVVEAPATVVARASATVTSPATGTIGRLYVKDGEKVGADEILLRIESPQARSALAQAQEADAAVASAGATPSAPSSAASQRQLKAADRAAKQAFAAAESANEGIADPDLRATADAQLAAARAQYKAARSAVDRATKQVQAGTTAASSAIASLTKAQRIQTGAAVAAAQRTVDALTVRAPVAGVVSFGAGSSSSSSGSGGGDLSSLVGQLPSSQQGLASSLLGGSTGASVSGDLARGTPVSSGQELLSVTDLSNVSLSAQVDETDVLLVRPGVPADAELAAVPGAVYAATVRAVSPSSTTSARGGVSYVVRLALGNGTTVDGTAAPAPRPGMSAVTSLKVRNAVGAVAVPASAVFQDGARSEVWLVVDGVAQRRQVRLGAQGEATYQILDGVEVGDSIVVRGADRVREGQRVG